MLDPQRAIPFAIVLWLFACAAAYTSVAAIITVMVPYFTLDPSAPLSAAFASVGWEWTNYIVAVGALSGL